jgi:hypothetical protein
VDVVIGFESGKAGTFFGRPTTEIFWRDFQLRLRRARAQSDSRRAAFGRYYASESSPCLLVPRVVPRQLYSRDPVRRARLFPIPSLSALDHQHRMQSNHQHCQSKLASFYNLMLRPCSATPSDTTMLRRNVTAVTDWRVLHKIMIFIGFYSHGPSDVVSQMRKGPSSGSAIDPKQTRRSASVAAAFEGKADARN